MTDQPLKLANAFIQAGELDDALQVLDAHLTQQPDDAAARRLRISVMMRLPDQQDAALAELAQIPDPTLDERVRTSVLYERTGQPDRAIATMRAALALAPSDERLAERLVHLLRQNGDLDGARALVATLPTTWRWLQQAGDLAHDAGDAAAARSHYDAALAGLEAAFPVENDWVTGFRARLLLARAGAAMTLADYDAAEADYQAAGEHISDDPLIPFNRGLLAALRGDLAEAVARCGHALMQANPTLQAHMETALRTDSRYAALAQLLLQGDNDI